MKKKKNQKYKTRTIQLDEKTRHLYIKWIDPKKKVPKLLEYSTFLPNDHSKLVLLKVKGSRPGMDSYRFGAYSPGYWNDDWYIEGCTGKFEVLAWAYITNPSKAWEKQ